MGLRVGYSFWGFLGDNKIERGVEASTPDGNATYGWGIVHELLRRGHQVFPMQKDRDAEAVAIHGPDNFAAFSQRERVAAYNHLHENAMTHGSTWRYPDLDVLLVEWRWPIPGRNCEISVMDPNFQDDLWRQNEILSYYSANGTRVVFWDLDHKLTERDEKMWDPDAILETSAKPRKLFLERTPVHFPVPVSCLNQIPMRSPDPDKKLVYIGNRYERDDVIEEYIKPVSKYYPGKIHFYGGWTKEPGYSEVKKMWPHISYHGRITTKMFQEVYQDALLVPLLAKRSYFETGFMTPRIWEALLFGSLPMGFEEMTGIDSYMLPEFVVRDCIDVIHLINEMEGMNAFERNDMRDAAIDKISFMDVSHFVDEVLG